MKAKEILKKNLSVSIEAKTKLFSDEESLEMFNSAIEALLSTYKKGGRLFLAGNGGSAADSQHLAAEFIGRQVFDRDPLPAEALTTDTSTLTAIANDYGYENWLKAAIRYYTKTNDLVVLLSVSGESKNLINAASFCKKKKIKLITITGATKNNSLSKKGTINYWINSKAYNIVETVQMAILASIVDRIIGKSEYSSNL